MRELEPDNNKSATVDNEKNSDPKPDQKPTDQNTEQSQSDTPTKPIDKTTNTTGSEQHKPKKQNNREHKVGTEADRKRSLSLLASAAEKTGTAQAFRAAQNYKAVADKTIKNSTADHKIDQSKQDTQTSSNSKPAGTNSTTATAKENRPSNESSPKIPNQHKNKKEKSKPVAPNANQANSSNTDKKPKHQNKQTEKNHLPDQDINQLASEQRIKAFLKQHGFYVAAAGLLLIAGVGIHHITSSGHQSLKDTTTTQQANAALIAAGQVQAQETNQSPNVGRLNTKLNQLLQQFEKQADAAQDKTVILNSLQVLTDKLNQQKIQEDTHIKALQDTLAQQYTDTQSSLSQIQDTIDSMHNALNPVQTIDAGQLPFHVVSIDVIAGQPVVSVRYNHATLPLEQGTHLAGWQLTQVSFADQSVEFIQHASNNNNTKTKLQPLRVSVRLGNTDVNGTTMKG